MSNSKFIWTQQVHLLIKVCRVSLGQKMENRGLSTENQKPRARMVVGTGRPVTQETDTKPS